MLLLYKDEIIRKIIREYPKIDKNVVEIILFGSVARGDFSPLSDIDLLIVTKNKKKTQKLFSEFRGKIYAKTSIMITAIYVTPEELKNNLDPLYKNIKQEGNLLWKKGKN